MSKLKIIANMARCKLCKDEIWSKHVRDHVQCSCGTIYIDGGVSDYGWRGGGEYNENISVYSDQPYHKLRHYILRGTRGKDGNEPLKYITLAQMSNEHLNRTLEYMQDRGQVDNDHYNYLRQELKFRWL